MEDVKSLIQNFVNGFGTGCSKEKMISNVHRFLCNKNIDNCILNDRYIEIDNCVIELIRRRSLGIWVVNMINIIK